MVIGKEGRQRIVGQRPSGKAGTRKGENTGN